MAKKNAVGRYSAEELADKRAKSETHTDWTKASAITDARLEATIAADPDEAGMVIDWDNASIEMPEPKVVLNMRVDRAVLDYFKSSGRGYQTRINAVLKSFVEANQRR